MGGFYPTTGMSASLRSIRNSSMASPAILAAVLMSPNSM